MRATAEERKTNSLVTFFYELPQMDAPILADE